MERKRVSPRLPYPWNLKLEDQVNQSMSRTTIFAIVVVLHVAILLLLGLSRTWLIPAPKDKPLQLVYLAPIIPPKVNADNNRPPRLATHVAISFAPPLVDA